MFTSQVSGASVWGSFDTRRTRFPLETYTDFTSRFVDPNEITIVDQVPVLNQNFLDSIDVFIMPYISDSTTTNQTQLSTQEQTLLRDWVEQGGVVVLGSIGYWEDIFRTYVEPFGWTVDVHESAQVTLTCESSHPLLSGDVSQVYTGTDLYIDIGETNSEILCTDYGDTFIAVNNFGSGAVIAFPSNVFLRVFMEEADNAMFLSNLVEYLSIGHDAEPEILHPAMYTEGEIASEYTGPGAETQTLQNVLQQFPRAIVFENQVIYDGDVVLAVIRDDGSIQTALVNGGTSSRKLLSAGYNLRYWDVSTIPYEIDDQISNRDVVMEAIEHWELNTEWRFTLRTNEQNYVKFRPSSYGCSALLGMGGGEQNVRLSGTCTLGNVIHEIGHTVGFWHEQNRPDRDDYVEVLEGNIDSLQIFNFEKQPSSQVELFTEYDYSSVMHYSEYASSQNGEPTILPRQNVEIGQRTGLSDLDIEGANVIYQMACEADVTCGAEPTEIVTEDGLCFEQWENTFPLNSDGGYAAFIPNGQGNEFDNCLGKCTPQNVCTGVAYHPVDGRCLIFGPNGNFGKGEISELTDDINIAEVDRGYIFLSPSDCGSDSSDGDDREIRCGDTLTGSTVGHPNIIGDDAGDVRYLFEISNEGIFDVVFDGCTSQYDTWLYVTAIEDPEHILCDCDDCECDGESTRTALSCELEGPNEFYFVGGGYGSNEGEYNVEIECQQKIENPNVCITEYGVDYSGNDIIKLEDITTPEDCCDACSEHPECLLWAYSPENPSNTCWLKRTVSNKTINIDRIIGYKDISGIFPSCGNGIVESPERCDDGNTDQTDDCLNTCHKSFCGDGVIQFHLGEECDDGNQNSDDGCKNCRLSCGDGVVDGNETCDDPTDSCCDGLCNAISNVSCLGSSADRCGSNNNKNTAGGCGCNRTDKDIDGDGELDCNDGCPRNPNRIAEPCDMPCGNCNTEQPGGGCSEQNVMDCVTGILGNNYCVDTRWDTSCVGIALALCKCFV